MLKGLSVGLASIVALASCATEFSEVAPRGGWRAVAERACMDRRAGSSSAYIVEKPAIIDGDCGMDFPLEVTALNNGRAAIKPTATLGCPVTEALDAWLNESVQPAAMAWIGSPVVEIKQISAYACRKRNNVGSGFSEHAFGNALDIAGFTFANGTQITFAKNWNGPPNVKSFFREIVATACDRFTTVLAPGSNIMHYNHIHVDLAVVAPDNSPKLCKPAPEVKPPERSPVDVELIATTPAAAPSVSTQQPSTTQEAAQPAGSPSASAAPASAQSEVPPDQAPQTSGAQ